MTTQWFFKDGELASGAWSAHVDAANPPSKPWAYTGIRIGEVSTTQSLELPADNNERVIFILEGPEALVKYQSAGNSPVEQSLRGRTSVFHGAADVLYLPINTSAPFQAMHESQLENLQLRIRRLQSSLVKKMCQCRFVEPDMKLDKYITLECQILSMQIA
jgi:5-deoxy-D-glucuronate isomerase